jgi:hypothetical protein
MKPELVLSDQSFMITAPTSPLLVFSSMKKGSYLQVQIRLVGSLSGKYCLDGRSATLFSAIELE